MASRLASAVAQRAKQEGLKLTNKQADLLVKEVLESIKADLKATGTARLPGLGSLKVVRTTPRTVPKSPGSTERMTTKAANRLRFKQFGSVKDEVQSYKVAEKNARRGAKEED